MDFYPNQLFHIFNQGNNQRQVFFSPENYHFFLWKMRAYLLPFGDLISYCLMPNHFHWQFYVRQVAIPEEALWANVDKVEYLRRSRKYGQKAQAVRRRSTRKLKPGGSLITLNKAIGLLEKSYADSVNKENGWSGSLFREHATAKDGWIDELVTVQKKDGTLDSRFLPGNDYAYRCMCYIHNNSVPSLVSTNTDWIFSSARDYAGLRKGTLCNLELGNLIINYM